MEAIIINTTLSFNEMCLMALAGAIGSVVKDILTDGALVIPYKQDGKLFLGCIGGAIIGSFVGMAVDGSFVEALFGGYAGMSIIENLVNRSKSVARTHDKKFQTL